MDYCKKKFIRKQLKQPKHPSNICWGIRNGCLEASLTIEATLSLTIFMFMVIILAMPMEMLDTQRKIQTVLESTGRELSRYAYICYRLTEGEEIKDTTEWADPSGIAGLFAESALKAYLTAKIEEAAGRGKISGLNLSGTSVSGNGEEINLQASYRLCLPFRVFVLDSVPSASKSLKRGWIGSRGGRNSGNGGEGEQEIMVYVGKTMTRYHLSPDCHYISNDISALLWDDIGGKVSSSGTRYKPCSICGKGAGSGSTVYIMPNGKYYHSKRDCSSISFYVQKVPLSEVEHLGACSYCGKQGR